MSVLKDKIAVVTGAAGVIGRAMTKTLIEDGCKVALVDSNKKAVDDFAKTLSGMGFAIICDISNKDAVKQAAAEIEKTIGAPDILINNAGILSNNKILETEEEEWHRILGVNLDAAFYFSQQFIPAMKKRKWGRIINTSSLAAKTGGLTAGTSYAVSKGAINSLTFSLARELAAFGITVNGICPAYVVTPMITEQLNEEQRQKLLNDIPVKRFCQPEEVAHVIRFLTSPLAGFITGEIVDINGGLLMD
jgi:3-oxoacyl-[acyl-carrier protein] reductase